MAIIKWREKGWVPFKDLFDLQRDTERWFDYSLTNLSQRVAKEGIWSPSVDVGEDKNNITISDK